MIVGGESTIIDYHAPFDQGLSLQQESCRSLRYRRNLTLVLSGIGLYRGLVSSVTQATPVGDSDFFSVPHWCHVDQYSNAS